MDNGKKTRQSWRVLTTEEVHALYGLPIRSLIHWRCHGKGPRFLRATKQGRVFYLTTDVERWLVAQRREAGVDAPT